MIVVVSLWVTFEHSVCWPTNSMPSLSRVQRTNGFVSQTTKNQMEISLLTDEFICILMYLLVCACVYCWRLVQSASREKIWLKKKVHQRNCFFILLLLLLLLLLMTLYSVTWIFSLTEQTTFCYSGTHTFDAMAETLQCSVCRLTSSWVERVVVLFPPIVQHLARTYAHVHTNTRILKTLSQLEEFQ